MEIIQIVGYKNSGKTTLASGFIRFLSKQGFQVGSIKHHGHGGVPLGIKNTDSGRHQNAGALIAGVEGEGNLQLSSANGWKLEQILLIYELLQMDIVIVEGFKDQPLNKIVLVNRVEDLELLDTLTNIKAIVSPFVLTSQYPVFHPNYLVDLYKWLNKQVNV